MKNKNFSLAMVGVVSLGGAAQADALSDVKDRGVLNCGVQQDLAGFSELAADGSWTGFDVDMCRAIAAAVFDDPDAVSFVPVTPLKMYADLRGGAIDVLSSRGGYALGFDSQVELEFAGATYYTGYGAMVNENIGVSSARELDGAVVCLQSGTLSALAWEDFSRDNGITYEGIASTTFEGLTANYLEANCDVLAHNIEVLAALRSTFSDASSQRVLPEIYGDVVTGLLVQADEQELEQVVHWSLNALNYAGNLGVTSRNVADMADTADFSIPINIRRLLGGDADLGAPIGLSADFAENIIKHVGNYDEIFDRNLGEETPIGMSKGLNAMWIQGGLMVPMGFR